MPGQQRGALVQLVRVELLKCLGDTAVHGRAALAKLGVVGDLLGQWVLERVDRLGVELLLIQELGRDQPPQRGLKLTVAERGRSRQYRLGELSADHRRALKQALLAL